MDAATIEKLADAIADRGFSGEQAKLLRRLAAQVEGDPTAAVTTTIAAFPNLFAVRPTKAGAPRRADRGVPGRRLP